MSAVRGELGPVGVVRLGAGRRADAILQENLVCPRIDRYANGHCVGRSRGERDGEQREHGGSDDGCGAVNFFGLGRHVKSVSRCVIR